MMNRQDFAKALTPEAGQLAGVHDNSPHRVPGATALMGVSGSSEAPLGATIDQARPFGTAWTPARAPFRRANCRVRADMRCPRSVHGDDARLDEPAVATSNVPRLRWG